VLTRGLFHVPFEWGRLGKATLVLGVAALVGELLLPADGIAGLASRLVLVALVPVALVLTGFLRPEERRAMARALR
jgi:hypothetical protein